MTSPELGWSAAIKLLLAAAEGHACVRHLESLRLSFIVVKLWHGVRHGLLFWKHRRWSTRKRSFVNGLKHSEGSLLYLFSFWFYAQEVKSLWALWSTRSFNWIVLFDSQVSRRWLKLQLKCFLFLSFWTFIFNFLLFCICNVSNSFQKLHFATFVHVQVMFILFQFDIMFIIVIWKASIHLFRKSSWRKRIDQTLWQFIIATLICIRQYIPSIIILWKYAGISCHFQILDYRLIPVYHGSWWCADSS